MLLSDTEFVQPNNDKDRMTTESQTVRLQNKIL